jgi:peptidyl-prolyl cis-trans isomerase A (cyclophilin A)
LKELNLCCFGLMKRAFNKYFGVRIVIDTVRCRQITKVLCGLLMTLSVASEASAGTIVRITTSLGNYSIELLDDIAPVTVQNFLNYVNRDAYDATYLHRVIDGFVVQGGGFTFTPFVGPVTVVSDPPIVNEFNVPNTRGTVAMAKLGGDPDSATTQWFVNLADNSGELDISNGGFTVFGNVLGDGMEVLDAIDALPTISDLGVNTPIAPYITPSYQGPSSFVYINAEVVERFSGAAHIYEVNSGKLFCVVSVDNDTTLVGLHFSTVSTANEVIVAADVKSIIVKRDSFDGIASYSTADGRLTIPSLEVFDGNTVSTVSNVVFVLSNPAAGQFVLESFDP